MPSIKTSRLNALQSTGPRTPEGKAASSRNRLSHGVFSATLLMPGEDPEAYRRFAAGFRETHQPSNPDEEFLVNCMILAAWRHARLVAMESRVLCAHANMGADAEDLLRSITDLVTSPQEPDPSANNDRLAVAWIRDGNSSNTMVKLFRYQTAMERSFHRARLLLETLRQNR